ncbi:MAG: PxKF domain-containing protein [Candidatus Limnocylindrales bacterium]
MILEGSVCDGVVASPSDGFVAPAGDYETLILANPSDMAAAIPGNGTADKTALADDLAAFAARTEVKGAIVDVGARTRITDLQDQAAEHVSCMYATNLVASAIRDVVTAYRATNPDLRYIVLVGGDDAIPFFRYPDQALLGPEEDFQAPVQPGTGSDASLRANYVLGQDAYGSSIDLNLHASAFPIPDLAVGRLVETAAEASVMLDAYLTTTGGTVATPTSALVTGYDFLDDAADAVTADLAAGLGTGGSVDQLVSDFDVAPQSLCSGTLTLPQCSWDADDFRSALLDERHDIAFLAGHFSANSTLAADFATTVLATELDGSNVDLTNAIVFSAGCHSGYNVVDPDAVTGGSVDWAQAFARKGATLIAGTGYQYGDTDFIEYSERIYAEFARQLRTGSGAVSVGEALARAKQIYLATTPDIRGLHHKALLESALFGLPMISVDMPGQRLPVPPTGSIVGSTTGFAANPGLTLGLRSADVALTPNLTQHAVPLDIVGGGTTTATYFSGSSGVVTNPYEPAVPLESRDVTVAGKVLRGVGFRGGAYSDQTVIPLTGAPADPVEQIRGVHAGWGSPVFYPMRLWTPNYFDALAGGPTRLLVTPAQHRTTGNADGSATLRLYSNLDLRLFYSSYTGDAGLSGAPTVADVSAEVNGGNVTFRARAFGDPQAGMQWVWVTYTGHADSWTSLDLVQDPEDSTLWTRTIPLPASLPGRAIQYMVQALNGVGLVTMDDNLGRLYMFGKGPQTLFFAALPDRTYPGADFTVSATASSGLAVSFSAAGQCEVVGTTVSLTGGGSCTITASQAGDDNYDAAVPIAHTFLIRLDQTITFTPAPTTKNLGDPPFSVVATSNSGLTVTQTATGVCSMSGTTVTLTAIGTCTIQASQAGNAAYNPVTAALVIDVNWPFTGFFSPVDNLPTVNVAKAGSTVPVKFNLGGDRGMGILAAGSPKAIKLATCSSTSVDTIEETTTSNGGLTYDPVSQQYKYNWKTEKTMSGCYRLDFTFIDGTTKSALFQLK